MVVCLYMLEYRINIGIGIYYHKHHSRASRTLASPVTNKIKLHMHMPRIDEKIHPQKILEAMVLAPLPGSKSLIKTLTMIKAIKKPKWIKATTHANMEGR